jgi:hypothetical protein
VRWHDKDVVVDGYDAEKAAEVGGRYEFAEAVQRWVGSWVPVPTDAPNSPPLPPKPEPVEEKPQ